MEEIHLITYEAVGKYKSVRRAIRRGHISSIGVIYPKRPFNNRKNRKLENLKRSIYEQVGRV